MQKNATVKMLLICLLLLLSAVLFAGCLWETYSSIPDNDKQLAENHHAREEERIKEEERRKEEERIREEERKIEERKQREAELKEKLGPFFVPLPPEEGKENPPVKAKGLYLTGNTAGGSRFRELLALVEDTELNAMVIDVKNDHGLLTYKSEIEIVKEVNSDKAAVIKDMEALLDELHSRDIYSIARIVVFRDPYLPEVKPEWAIQKRGGGLWRDYGGFAWVNPYDKNVWDYNIAIAKEAALKGFKEIQFDYVRFPENARRVDREAEYPGAGDLAKDEAIKEFLQYAAGQLKDYNVHLAADVFGVIATSRNDADGIGQTWEKISPYVGYICPMIYPSHYSRWFFGFNVPDANPAGTVTRALTDAIKRNGPLRKPAIIRPWLQGFTATWVKGHIPYGPREIREQIDAALSLGIDEFLIWNAHNKYYADSFLTEAEAKAREEKKAAERSQSRLDVLNRSREKALADYLTAVKNKDWREVYLWQFRDTVQDESEVRKWVAGWTGSLVSYSISVDAPEESEEAKFNVVYSLQSGESVIQKESSFTLVLENSLWKVKPAAEFLAALTER